MQTEKFDTDVISVGRRHRHLDTAKVEALVSSISEIGLKTPISVRCIDDEDMLGRPVLIAGHHRLEAYKRLGLAEIECFVLDDDDLHAELWEIDENLMRAGLSDAEETQHLARRKEIWTEMQNQSGQLVPVESKRDDGRGHRKKEFAQDTADKTGQSKRDINRKISRAVIPDHVLDKIKGTPLDKGNFLDRIKVMEVPAMEATVKAELKLRATMERDREAAAERAREAKEAAQRARNEACDLLLDALPPRKWDRLIGLIDAAGGSLRAADLRNWQAPSVQAAE